MTARMSDMALQFIFWEIAGRIERVVYSKTIEGHSRRTSDGLAIYPRLRNLTFGPWDEGCRVDAITVSPTYPLMIPTLGRIDTDYPRMVRNGGRLHLSYGDRPALLMS